MTASRSLVQASNGCGLSSLMSKSTPTLLLSFHPQQWQEVDSDYADAVSFSDRSCSGPRDNSFSRDNSVSPREDQSSRLHHCHPDLLILLWEKAFTGKILWCGLQYDDTSHLCFAVMQPDQSLVSVNMWQGRPQCSHEHTRNLSPLRGGSQNTSPHLGFISISQMNCQC